MTGFRPLAEAPDLDSYVDSCCSPEPQALTAARDHTWRHRLYPRMATSHARGRLLAMLAALAAPRLALEIGTFTGCSAMCLAEGLPEGAMLHTIEIDDESEPTIRANLARSPHGSKVTLHIGDALHLLPRLAPQLQGCGLVHIDGNKRNYCDYLDLVMPLLAPGALIIADNTLWGGKAADPRARDAQTLGIRTFNSRVAADPRLEAAMIADADGLTLLRLRG